MDLHDWYLGLLDRGHITKEICLLRMQELRLQLELRIKEVEKTIEKLVNEE